VVLLAGVAAALAGPVYACSLDNRPSMSADGVLAHRTTAGPTAADLATWAPFTVPRVFRARQAVHFSENQADVRLTLPPSALTHPWRWSFGDGGASVGYSPSHTYRHAGTYKISVRAYFTATNYSQWLEFDAVTIRVR
jgi:hypothetical protein